MAEIWRAKQFGAAGFQKQLVIKKILQHLADNDEFIRMFIDEAKIAVQLQHANIVQIFDLGAVEREYFIAMEYVAGRDLLNLLIRCTHLRRRIPVEYAIYIVTEALKGLEAAHTATDKGTPLNIIHRDVSPSNVLISFEGEVKIGDFGVARARQRESTTKSGTLKGKLGYMSPEQVNGEAIDQRADLFSAGILLYEMLAMNRLFHGKTDIETLMMVRDCKVDEKVARLPDSVDSSLRAILLRALAPDPNARYQTATEFIEALLDYMFNHKIRLTQANMGRFMKSVFQKEIDEEIAYQREIDAITADMASMPLEDSAQPKRTPVFRPSAQQPILWGPASRFRTKCQDGLIMGPMSFNSLLDLYQHSPNDAQQVSIDQGPWVPSDTLALKDSQMQAPLQPPNFSGKFDRYDLPRLIYRYAVCKATGRMHLEMPGKRKDIFWRRGRPEFVQSNLRSEHLGEFLIERHLISRAYLNEALAHLSAFGDQLDDALIHLNLIAPHELLNAMTAQVKAMLIELFSWSGGQYAFYSGEFTSAQIVPLETSAYALINEGICGRFALDDFKTFFLAKDDRPIQLLNHQKLHTGMLQLTTKQMRIWNAVEHNVPIEEQMPRRLQIPGVSPLDVYQVLFLMERLEFASFG